MQILTFQSPNIKLQHFYKVTYIELQRHDKAEPHRQL